MEEVPKIVAERLEAVVGTAEHPDANLLAGFAEKSLTSREQAQVLGHLANCALCREVVAHAQAAPAMQVAAAAPVRKRAPWFQAPVLRWGALAGCVAVVGTVMISRSYMARKASGIEGYKNAEVTIAKIEPASPSPPRATVANSEISPAEADKARLETRTKRDESEYGYAKQQPVAGAAGEKNERLRTNAGAVAADGLGSGQGYGRATGGLAASVDEKKKQDNLAIGGPVAGQRRDLTAFTQLQPGVAASAPSNKAPETVVTNGAPGNRPAATPVGGDLARVAPLSSQAAPKLADKESAARELQVAQAMKAPTATTETVQVESAAPAVPTKVESANGAEVAANGQPVITLPEQEKQTSSAGMLYKSKDGITGGAVAGMMHSRVQLPKPRWQISSDGKLLRSNDAGDSWQPVPVAANVVFRALCITGPEVWVGGAQGSLFYSSDAGGHWEQVKPAVNGHTLTADITAIEFTDPQHGKLSTADQQTWITSDTGHTWRQK